MWSTLHLPRPTCMRPTTSYRRRSCCRAGGADIPIPAQILLIAKQPVPGSVKTRLTPALSAAEAAEVASACLQDTVEVLRAVGATRIVVILDGSDDGLGLQGLVVRPQVEGGLDVRLAAAFAAAFTDSSLPALLVGMDTPQMTPDLLDCALEQLLLDDIEAVLGRTEDGGWWALGLTTADPRLLHGVPMSTAGTGAAQRERLDTFGLRVAELPVLRDIDLVEDLQAVAASLVAAGRSGALVPLARRLGRLA